MSIQELNELETEEQKSLLFKCCGASAWLQQMISKFPFESESELLNYAEKTWFDLSVQDWKEAFSHHPKIGDLNSMKEKFAATAQWAAGEQAAVKQTSDDVLVQLSMLNQDYQERFGYIFIVCATGKSAEEMLDLLKARLRNDPEEEIKIAAGEQNKITVLRLKKLLGESLVTE